MTCFIFMSATLSSGMRAHKQETRDCNQTISILQDNIKRFTKNKDDAARLKVSQAQSLAPMPTAEHDPRSVYLDRLSQEYEKLRQERMNLAEESRKTLDRQQAVLKERMQDIKIRQKEFDEELDKKDQALRDSWKPLVADKVSACDQLLSELERVHARELEEAPSGSSSPQQHKIEVVLPEDQESLTEDSLILVPLPLMELFWQIDVDAPVFLREVEPSITSIRERRAELNCSENEPDLK